MTLQNTLPKVRIWPLARKGSRETQAFGGDDVVPRDLQQTLRLEYRSKLLNPKWVLRHTLFPSFAAPPF